MNSVKVITILASSRPQEEALRSVVEHVQGVRLGACLPLWLGNWPAGELEMAPDVALLDVPASLSGIRERVHQLRSRWPQAAWIAVGAMDEPQRIVEMMRAGVSEYLERPLTTGALQEALARLPAAPARMQVESGERMRLCLLGAHGGVGTTTIAVNLAALLQRHHGTCLLVDLAPMGHAALHLNLKPGYGLTDALLHMERLDEAVMSSLVIRHECGLQLLAGSPRVVRAPASDVVQLMEALHRHFRIMVLDLSGRWDEWVAPLTRWADRTLLVSQADVIGLWSAARVNEQLGVEEGKVQLVLNRYRRQSGFDLKHAERAVRAPVLGTLPGAYASVAEAIAEGELLTGHRNRDLARAFLTLAQELMPQDKPQEASRWTLFRR